LISAHVCHHTPPYSQPVTRARKELKDQISAGELVADDVVIDLVKEQSA